MKQQHTPIYAKPQTIERLLDISSTILEDWEREKLIIEGIHFVRLKGGRRQYCVPLMVDRLANLHDDDAHTRARDAWLRSLPSNQKKIAIVG